MKWISFNEAPAESNSYKVKLLQISSPLYVPLSFWNDFCSDLFVLLCVILFIMYVIMQEQIYERFPPQINITKLVIHGSQIIIPTERARVYADQLWPPLLIILRRRFILCFFVSKFLLLLTYCLLSYIFKMLKIIHDYIVSCIWLYWFLTCLNICCIFFQWWVSYDIVSSHWLVFYKSFHIGCISCRPGMQWWVLYGVVRSEMSLSDRTVCGLYPLHSKCNTCITQRVNQ